MYVQVNQELCAGCGVCVETCPSEAIRLVNQHAVVIEGLCTGCEACVPACPNEALSILSQPIPEHSLITQPVIEHHTTPSAQQKVSPRESSLGSSIKPLAGTILTYLGTEIVPRLVDALGRALELKITQPKVSTKYQPPATINNASFSGRGRRTRNRYRGRIANTKKTIMKGGE